ncbi:MAG: hypothetical protein OSA48_02330 [Akkermansiaceae bacterium]|nr:hypothetical protein [Akkermansiaceae bacterium]
MNTARREFLTTTAAASAGYAFGAPGGKWEIGVFVRRGMGNERRG